MKPAAASPGPAHADAVLPAWWRRRWVRTTVTVSVLALIAVVVDAFIRGHQVDAADPAAVNQVPQVATATVTSGSMVDVTNVRGTLGFSGEMPVTSGSTGVITSLPAEGTTVRPGGVLYTVDTRPVVLLAGAMPAWRTFQMKMTDGQDVRQLEEYLSFSGWLHEKPDTRFTEATDAAVRAWQRSLGVQSTGVIKRGAVLFSGQPLRVASFDSRLGADVAPGTALYKTSSVDKVVAADLTLDDQQLAVRGAAVTIVLPDGKKLPGKVTGSSEAVQRPGTDGSAGTFVVPVAIGLADQAGAASFSQADVTVQFPSTLGQDLLTVPVEALIALDSSHFGVEVPDAAKAGGTTVLPVTVGAFASGRVAISGKSIASGLRVVVAGP